MKIYIKYWTLCAMIINIYISCSLQDIIEVLNIAEDIDK